MKASSSIISARTRRSSRHTAGDPITADGIAVADHRVMPDQHVLDHAHALEDAQHLEGARDAEPRDLVRLLARDVLPVEHDAGAGLGLVDARNQIEQRALARAVRPDDAAHLALLHREVDLGDGGESAEPLGQVLHLKQHSSAFCAAIFLASRIALKRRRTRKSSMMPPMPRGMKITTSTITMPNIIMR